MKKSHVTMVLSYNGEEVASVLIEKSYGAIEKQRYRWVHTYGLSKKKQWEIYIVMESSMGDDRYKDTFKIIKQFPFLTKQTENNESAQTISEFI